MLMLSTASPQPLIVILRLYTACLLLVSLSRDAAHRNLVAAAAAAATSPFSFSFDFSSPSIYRSDDLLFEGDAAMHDQLVDLTCTSSQGQSTGGCMGLGRMSYNHPVPFYDSATGQVASFTTRFSFAINGDAGQQPAGEGMAFFLSSYPSRLPPYSGGGDLGLRSGSSADRFVAVEFDTFSNTWDPCDDNNNHMAIDINTARDSANTTCFDSFNLNGSMTASIAFDHSNNMLLASLSFDDNPSRHSAQVSMQLPDPVTSLLPPQVGVGFSAATGSSFELHQILSWCFESTIATRTVITSAPEAQTKAAPRWMPTNETGAPKAQPKLTPLLTGNETGAPRAQEGPVPVVTGKGNGAPEAQQRSGLVTAKGHAEMIIREVALPITLLVGSILVWSILSWYRWKRTRDSFAQGTIGLKRFEYSVLAAATGKFSDEKRLGEGAFGAVYRGRLTDEDGREQRVAVKKIKDTRGKTKDFLSELKAISETRHMNLVRLYGWCCSPTIMDVMFWSRQQKVKLFLVYELVSNGNLDYHLHRRDQILSWPTRYQIVKGIASALHYLHHESERYIVHRDIKPSNILLDDGYNAKLADFGLSRIANHNSTTPMTLAIGTEGYIDPQCRKHGLVKFGRRSDVYSFGIVLLNIACTNMCREQVWELYKHIAEPQVEAAADAKLRGVFDRKQMERVVVLGLRCSDPDGEKRPSMHDAMQFLELGTELPAITRNEDDQGSVSISMSADEEVLPPPGAGSSS